MKQNHIVPCAFITYGILLIGMILLLAFMAGCSTNEAVDAYAREHNIYGERVCNTLEPDVDEGVILERGCPAGGSIIIDGEVQHENEEAHNKETETVL